MVKRPKRSISHLKPLLPGNGIRGGDHERALGKLGNSSVKKKKDYRLIPVEFSKREKEKTRPKKEKLFTREDGMPDKKRGWNIH